MALAMVRPTKHPKTGVYRVRKAVPEPLREAALALFGTSRELIVSLKTKDPAQAAAAAPRALQELEKRFEAIRAHAAGSPPQRMPDRLVQALAGDFYRQELARWGDDPTKAGDWDYAQRLLLDEADWVPVENGEPDELEYAPVVLPEDRERVISMIASAGHLPNPENIERLGKAVFMARYQFAEAMKRRVGGDWRPDETIAKYPTLPTLEREPKPEVTFDSLLRSWAQDRGLSVDARPVQRAVYDRQRTLARLAEFLGHSDASKVTKADAVRWKESMHGDGLQIPTIRNDFSEMSAIWKHAIREGRLPEGSNPFAGVAPPKPKAKRQTRRPFTGEEAAEILGAARSQRGFLRWLPWVLCLTGARLAEICQSVKEDVIEIDGIPVLRIHGNAADDEDGVRSVKNPSSERDVPIHPALIAEGFLDYVKGLPARSPLFPDVRPGKQFKSRASKAGQKMSRWVRGDLGIADERVSPAHSWRHWFIDACRRAQLHPEVRSSLTGHSAKLDESAGYGVGMGSMTRILADAIAKVEPPIPPLACP